MIGLMEGLWRQASMQAYNYVMSFPSSDNPDCGCIACLNFRRLVRECPLTMQHPQHTAGNDHE